MTDLFWILVVAFCCLTNRRKEDEGTYAIGAADRAWADRVDGRN